MSNQTKLERLQTEMDAARKAALVAYAAYAAAADAADAAYESLAECEAAWAAVRVAWEAARGEK